MIPITKRRTWKLMLLINNLIADRFITLKKSVRCNHINYNNYIKSRTWYGKHPQWLKIVNYRCTMFPWVRIGKGKHYAIHHMHYKNLGNERLGRDVVPLCTFAHNFIIHGILSGFKSAGKQHGYPNLVQRFVHFWCVQRLWFKLVIAVGAIAAILIIKIF